MRIKATLKPLQIFRTRVMPGYHSMRALRNKFEEARFALIVDPGDHGNPIINNSIAWSHYANQANMVVIRDRNQTVLPTMTARSWSIESVDSTTLQNIFAYYRFSKPNDIHPITANELIALSDAQHEQRTKNEFSHYTPGLLSVIVPAYNAERTLSTAINSVLKQNIENIEIVIVDNGSSDGTRAVIEMLSAENPIILPIYINENQGVFGARNIALDSIKGEFVAFCDADDYVPQESYKAMLSIMQSSGADIVVGGCLSRKLNGRIYEHPIFNSESDVINYFESGAIWNKLYHRRIIENPLRCRFEPFNYGEDTLFLGRVTQNKPRYAMLNQCVYCHLDHAPQQDGIQLTQQHSASNLEEYVRVGLELFSLDLGCTEEDMFKKYWGYLCYLKSYWNAIESAADREEGVLYLKRLVSMGNWAIGQREAMFSRTFKTSPSTFCSIDSADYLTILEKTP